MATTKTKVREIEPPDCYARAKLIEAEVELIRLELGRARDERPAASVAGAAPREVYFQALSLFRKADRLCHEITGDQLAQVPHAPPIASIRPADVLAVLDAALREIVETKARLGIKEKSKEPAREPRRVPSDVFATIVGVNRQLNLLLERPFAPGDVYQQVSLAVAYASRLASHAGVSASPAMPKLPRRMRPADCFARLTGVVGKLQGLVAASGLQMLTQPPARPGRDEDVVPGDVYDLASLVLSELAFLHAHIADANPPYPFEANLPGRKLPSHVYQLATYLEAQLDKLRGRSLVVKV